MRLRKHLIFLSRFFCASILLTLTACAPKKAVTFLQADAGGNQSIFQAVEPAVPATLIASLPKNEQKVGSGFNTAFLGQLVISNAQISVSLDHQKIKMIGHGAVHDRRFEVELIGIVQVDGTAKLFPTKEDPTLPIRAMATCLDGTVGDYKCSALFIDVYVRIGQETFTEQYQMFPANPSLTSGATETGTGSGQKQTPPRNSQNVQSSDQSGKSATPVQSHSNEPTRSPLPPDSVAAPSVPQTSPTVPVSQANSLPTRSQIDAGNPSPSPQIPGTVAPSVPAQSGASNTSADASDAQTADLEEDEAPTPGGRFVGFPDRVAQLFKDAAGPQETEANDAVVANPATDTTPKPPANTAPVGGPTRPVVQLPAPHVLPAPVSVPPSPPPASAPASSRPVTGSRQAPAGPEPFRIPRNGADPEAAAPVAVTPAPPTPAPPTVAPPTPAPSPSTELAARRAAAQKLAEEKRAADKLASDKLAAERAAHQNEDDRIPIPPIPPGPSQDRPASPSTAPTAPVRSGTPAAPTADSTPVALEVTSNPGSVVQAIGCHSRGRGGCAWGGQLMNATLLPASGVGYRELHPDREMDYGTDRLVRFIQSIGAAIAQMLPGYQVAVADLSAHAGGNSGPRKDGGHQNGLDADIGYFVKVRAATLTKIVSPGGVFEKDLIYVPEQWRIFKTVVHTGLVNVIFADRAIKAGFCEYARQQGDNSEEANQALRRLVHCNGHQNHWHLRLKCPSTVPRCQDDMPIPNMTGC